MAVRGAKEDGHRFIGEAVRRGARVIVGEAERPNDLPPSVFFIQAPDARMALARLAAGFHGNPAGKMKVIGITGTNGKTTTAYLLEYLLAKQGKRVGVIGTVDYRFNGRVVPAGETTPGPVWLHELLSQMAQGGCEYAVMEVSSHALDQHRVHGIPFERAVFTNLTQDHLDYHKTLEGYFECKARLFSELPRDRAAIVNGDDPWGEKLLGRISARAVTYGTKEGVHWRAEAPRTSSLSGTSFEARWEGERFWVASPLVGRHNVYNVLGALACAASLGLDGRKAGRDLEGFPGVPGRLERVDGGQDFGVFVDYAHTPDGLSQVLQSLRPCAKRLFVVFGCGGERDRDKRPKMGKIAAERADFVYLTSDNPRSEDPAAIAGEIRAGFPPDFKRYAVVLDRKKAVRQALLAARSGDLVLLAGKGHETVQVIGGQKIPYSDREEAKRIFDGH